MMFSLQGGLTTPNPPMRIVKPASYPLKLHPRARLRAKVEKWRKYSI
ncbi:MAG: hypothetical protein IT434_05695 [Phycisphaerales bacterium]|jgi:hypothetical protein|nr:hypothetical protein [Phycisphaerales bacterium]